jgi:hypothetical protein
MAVNPAFSEGLGHHQDDNDGLDDQFIDVKAALPAFSR